MHPAFSHLNPNQSSTTNFANHHMLPSCSNTSLLEELQKIPDLIGLILSFVPQAQRYLGICRFLDFHILHSFHPIFLYRFRIPAKDYELSFLNIHKYAYFQPSYAMIRQIFYIENNLEASIDAVKYVAFILKSKFVLSDHRDQQCFLTLCCEYFVEEQLENGNLQQLLPCLFDSQSLEGTWCTCKRHQEFAFSFCTFITSIAHANNLDKVDWQFLRAFSFRFAVQIWKGENAATSMSVRNIQLAIDYWSVLSMSLLRIGMQENYRIFFNFVMVTDYTDDNIRFLNLLGSVRQYFLLPSFRLNGDGRPVDVEISCFRSLLFEFAISFFLEHAKINEVQPEIWGFLFFFLQQAETCCNCQLHKEYSGSLISDLLRKTNTAATIEFTQLLFKRSARYFPSSRANLVTNLLNRPTNDHSLDDGVKTSEWICNCFFLQQHDNPLDVFSSLSTSTIRRLQDFTMKWKDLNPNLFRLLEICYPMYAKMRNCTVLYFFVRFSLQIAGMVWMKEQSFFLLLACSLLVMEISLCMELLE